MTRAVKAMYDLGFIDTTDKQDVHVVRQFTKYSYKGYETDIINFIGSKEFGLDVFTNNLVHRCGSRLDRDLLNAITLNIIELEGK